MPAFSALRAGIVLAILAAALLAMTGRVAYLQTYARQRAIRSAERQQHVTGTVLARRGSIFAADGSALALTVQTMSLYIDPQFLLEQYATPPRTPRQQNQDLRKLADIADLPLEQLLKCLAEKPEARYLRLRDGLSDRQCDEIRKLDIPGVGLEPRGARYYPMGSLAAHVLGTVRRDNTGLEGIELRYDKELAGKDGWKRVQKDARRRPIGMQAEDYIPPVHGQHIVLTIDANIQMIAEQELAAVCVEKKAKRGEVVVMNPRTGEVLALANWPTFNPQNLEDSKPDLRRNRAITDPYEPGSTLKPFVMGPALDWKLTRPNEVWPIHAQTITMPYGKGRRVSDVHHYGPLASWDVLVKSSNIGMCLLANRMGQSRLHRALELFQFGRFTGIELPGEDQGLLNPLKRWSRASTESVAQGYEMMVTPLQIARAFCVFANGGHLVQPRIVKGILDAQGNVVSRHPIPGLNDTPKVMDEETAALMRQIMADVVVRGTGTSGRSKVWNIFGKTGTAHIARRGVYQADQINASFICGAPLENPEIVVAFIVHEPDRSLGRYGGGVAAPGAMHVIERTLAYLQIQPSPPIMPPPPSIAAVLHNFDPRKYAGSGKADSVAAAITD